MIVFFLFFILKPLVFNGILIVTAGREVRYGTHESLVSFTVGLE